jgi:hypothetical protein
MSETLKRCRAGRGHDDALALVEYLIARGGSAQQTNETIAMALQMLVNRGGGNWQVDTSRFVQARNHVKDGTTEDGKPCSGYRLHYRTSARGSELTLIDPVGDLGPHASVAVETIRGWMTRESQHHTENHRQIETVERLGDHALARGDREGYRLCTRMSVELERDGTVSPSTMAEVQVWLGSLAA